MQFQDNSLGCPNFGLNRIQLRKRIELFKINTVLDCSINLVFKV